jgi:hypothetical protein
MAEILLKGMRLLEKQEDGLQEMTTGKVILTG